MSTSAELRAELARIQAELAALKCPAYVQAHLFHGSTCELDNDGHEWHQIEVHYSAIDARYLITAKWKMEVIEDDNSE